MNTRIGESYEFFGCGGVLGSFISVHGFEYGEGVEPGKLSSGTRRWRGGHGWQISGVKAPRERGDSQMVNPDQGVLQGMRASFFSIKSKKHAPPQKKGYINPLLSVTRFEFRVINP